ncbi:YihY/virulence factor BrkB family protein [Beijerinckia sp. L45]|uniref:YihY/virulence factor BrkB family protein n=1 Tax=Beijerinckia sp. L45 TaxID=1641855 RepID=UPI00131B3B53|nr:YihY/virulence factor BrkB family protein [Beijerinckia sp. L45]
MGWTTKAPTPAGKAAAPALTVNTLTHKSLLPWYIIVLGIAVAASTSAAQKRAVAMLSDPGPLDKTDPLPGVAPDWLRNSRQARSLYTIITRVIRRMSQDNLSLVAAGVAFYAMFAVFPALGALVSIYGLFGDAHIVQTQVLQLTALLPRETAKLINDALTALISKPSSNLNFGLLFSLGIAIWGARAGTSSLIAGLNVAVEKPETRSVFVTEGIAIGLAFGAIIFAIVALTTVAVIPLALGYLDLDPRLAAWLAYSRWPILAAFILLALDVIYRFGPSLGAPRWRFISVGTLFSAILWIAGTWAFSAYVTRFGSDDTTYGSLGAVVVLLLWFLLSALIVLLGATVDAVRGEMR